MKLEQLKSMDMTTQGSAGRDDRFNFEKCVVRLWNSVAEKYGASPGPSATVTEAEWGDAEDALDALDATTAWLQRLAQLLGTQVPPGG